MTANTLVSPGDEIVIARLDSGSGDDAVPLQVLLKRAGCKPVNVTSAVAKACQLACVALGIEASEYQLIEAIFEHIPLHRYVIHLATIHAKGGEKAYIEWPANWGKAA